MLDRRTLLFAAPALKLAAPGQSAANQAICTAYEAATRGRIGVFAENLKTAGTVSWRAHDRFLMCSSFKASLAGFVLARVDRGQERLDRVIGYGRKDIFPNSPIGEANLAKGGLTVGQMCQAAVEVSDNTCANLLLKSVGGPAALTAFWRALGDNVTRLDHFELELNRGRPGSVPDTTSPAAMAGTLRRLIVGDALSPVSRGRLTDWMVACKTGANRLRSGLPAAWRIGDKTGNNGKDAAGDIAVAWPAPERPIVMAVYVFGGSPNPKQIQDVFAAVARTVAQELA